MNTALFVLFAVLVIASSYLMYHTISKQIGNQSDQTNERITSQSQQLGEIHELVNSNLTAVKADLAIALDRIATLEELLTRKI